MTIEQLNEQIKEDYCEDYFNQLSDVELMNDFKDSPSVKKIIEKISGGLKTFNLSDNLSNKIVNLISPFIIPAGTKGVIRGNKFNEIVKVKICDLKICELINTEFEIGFESKMKFDQINEKPDWVITRISDKKTLIGMNQVSLWGGGAQLNRADKYIKTNLENNSKLVCVICNHPGELKSLNEKNEPKLSYLLKKGFEEERIVYISKLKDYIKKYFDLGGK